MEAQPKFVIRDPNAQKAPEPTEWYVVAGASGGINLVAGNSKGSQVVLYITKEGELVLAGLNIDRAMQLGIKINTNNCIRRAV